MKPSKLQARRLMAEFEGMRNLAEARAWSKISLERPLTQSEGDRFLSLKEKVFPKGKPMKYGWYKSEEEKR